MICMSWTYLFRSCFYQGINAGIQLIYFWGLCVQMEMEETKVSYLWQVSHFSCLLLSLLGGLLWIIQIPASLAGFWSLPVGLLQLEFTVLALIGSLFGGFYFKKKYFLGIGFINCILCSSFFSVSCAQESAGVNLLSWNVAGSNDSQIPCLRNYVTNWSQQHERKIVFLQEVQQQHKTDFENALQMTCFWSDYVQKKSNATGLLVCHDQTWESNEDKKLPYESGEDYGFQFLELKDKRTNNTINLLNIHLESLWRTLDNMYGESDDITLKESFVETIRGNPEILLPVLKANAKSQRSEIDALFAFLKNFRDPTLIAGDFNSPPNLWFHRYLRKHYNDAHVKTGFGFGYTTFRLSFIRSRVDYLYASPEVLLTGNTWVDRETSCSDHFPVLSSFSFSN